MDSKYISKLTHEILSLKNSKKPYEFLLACANARSMVENQMAVDNSKKMNEALWKNLAVKLK